MKPPRHLFRLALAVCLSLALPFASGIALLDYAKDCTAREIDQSVRGLENFNTVNNLVTSTLVPDLLLDDYMSFTPIFPYESGDFFYRFQRGDVRQTSLVEAKVCRRTLLYLQYDEDTYAQAKQFLLEQGIRHPKEPLFTYGGAVFYENNSPWYFREGDEPAIDNDNAPYEFSYFAYDDSRRILLFLAFYSENLNEEVEAEAGSREELISLYFGEWYSFT